MLMVQKIPIYIKLCSNPISRLHIFSQDSFIMILFSFDEFGMYIENRGRKLWLMYASYRNPREIVAWVWDNFSYNITGKNYRSD